MPLRVIVTVVTRADCTHAGTLIDGMKAQYLLADRGYDSDAIIAQHLKRWRSIATRCAKRAESFLAAAQIRCLAI
jgi:transposase